VAEIVADLSRKWVYIEGWQSWRPRDSSPPQACRQRPQALSMWLAALDQRGLELTRRLLRPASVEPVAWDPFLSRPRVP
jgi:hypothetical protein